MEDVGSDTIKKPLLGSPEERRLGESLQSNKCQSWALKDE